MILNQINFKKMKKIFFATLMLMFFCGITYAQTTPVKTATTQTPQKEMVKKETKSVSAVTPAKTTGKTAKTETKPAVKPAAKSDQKPAAATNKVASTNAIKKHKKHHSVPKKTK